MSALDDLLLKQYHDAGEADPSEAAQASAKSDDLTPANENPNILAEDAEEAAGIAGPIPNTLDVVTKVEASAFAKSESQDVVQADSPALTCESPTASQISDVADVEDMAVTESQESEPNSDPRLDTQQRQAFRPDWEVDRFLWPRICEEVEDRAEVNLTSAVASIELECERHHSNLVAVTSATAHAGSTTITLCLAREAARQGLRIAMVDLNHRHPGLTDQLGVACEHGLESLDNDAISAENICVSAVDDGVTLVPLLEAIDVGYCAGATLQQLLKVMGESHDLVLIDASAEAIQLLNQQSAGLGVIIVGERDVIREANKDAAKMVEDLIGADARAIGVVENFAA